MTRLCLVLVIFYGIVNDVSYATQVRDDISSKDHFDKMKSFILECKKKQNGCADKFCYEILGLTQKLLSSKVEIIMKAGREMLGFRDVKRLDKCRKSLRLMRQFIEANSSSQPPSPSGGKRLNSAATGTAFFAMLKMLLSG